MLGIIARFYTMNCVEVEIKLALHLADRHQKGWIQMIEKLEKSKRY
jgi:hypothetical protein